MVGQCDAAGIQRERAAPGQAFVDEHPEFARQMVIADARLAQRRFAWTGTHAHGACAERDAHHGFEQVRDVGVGDAEITVPALRLDGEQARLAQLGEVRADRLARDAGGVGQFRRGQGHAAHQHVQHFGARLVADQGGDVRDIRSVSHMLRS